MSSIVEIQWTAWYIESIVKKYRFRLQIETEVMSKQLVNNAFSSM